MRFYNQPHAYYCGVDLHARSMFTHVLDQAGAIVFAKDLPADPHFFLDAVAPFRPAGLVVGCECMFAWYWLADLCEDEAIPFTLGHAGRHHHDPAGKSGRTLFNAFDGSRYIVERLSRSESAARPPFQSGQTPRTDS